MAATPLTARHGDLWLGPLWAVAVDRTGTVLADWHLRAQARLTPDADVLIEWTVAGGGIVLGSAQVRLSDGSMVTTGALRLRLRPADWAGLPRSWKGLVEVEMSSDDTAHPEETITVVPARRFVITPDVAR